MKKVILVLSFILLAGIGLTFIFPEPVKGALALTQAYVTNWPAKFNVEISNSTAIPMITKRQNWEYKKTDTMSDTQMNVLGADGWELWKYDYMGNSWVMVWKRPVQ